MKKNVQMMLVISLALVCTMVSWVSCKTTGYPRFVRDSLKNVPDDVLVGIGTAHLTDLNLAMNTATSQAMAEISRQIHTIVTEMVINYQAVSNVDSSIVHAFQESIIMTLHQTNLVGARIIKRDRAKDGSVWAVIWMDKENVLSAVDRAQIAAKQTVPEMESFEAQDWLDAAFAKTASQGYRGTGR